jgi:hypothetical protein
MVESFRDFPGAVESTLEFADRCDVEIALGGQLIPSFECPDGLTEKEYLRRLVEAGLRERYGDPLLDLVIGRTSADPALLKPSPHLVTHALDAFGAATDESILIGDSTSDIAAGREAGIARIGYANKPGKRHRLANAGAQLVDRRPGRRHSRNPQLGLVRAARPRRGRRN